MRIVDAHVHLWDTRHVRLSWFRPDLALPGAVTAEDFAAAARPSGVGAAVAVQAADTVEEARWLRGEITTAAVPLRMVVQYEPLPGAPDRWAGAMHEMLTTAAGSRDAAAGAAGVRVAAPTAATDLSDVAGLDELARGLAAAGRVLEMLVRPAQLPAVSRLARRHPHLHVVVCHLGLGAAAADAEWASGIARLAAEPRIAAKLSGLHPERRTSRALTDAASRVFDSFGADRLLYGSDWPMSTRALAYDDVIGRLADALPALGSHESAAFWGANATVLYGVPAAS